MAPLTQYELDQMRCGKPGCECTTISLRGNCHPEDPLRITYDRDDGVLTVRCATCDELVAYVEVAP